MAFKPGCQREFFLHPVEWGYLWEIQPSGQNVALVLLLNRNFIIQRESPFSMVLVKGGHDEPGIL